jgi:hypothetical protein
VEIMHDEGLNNSSPDIIGMTKSMAGCLVLVAVIRNVYKIFIGKPGGKIPLGRCGLDLYG